MMGGETRRARLVAFYLPQYHPIPENDKWWGKGFTEWTNVTKARPLYPGHRQPHLPSNLGFYDLRVPETRVAQAELAGAHGIEGFCYWHYWFAGRRVLERPFEEVLASGSPDFPFCLGWANESWTGAWHGLVNRRLIDQTYPGESDYEAHFYSLMSAFTDARYLKVSGKLLFYVYKPEQLPCPREFADCWRRLASREGIADFHFVANSPDYLRWQPSEHGFDGHTPRAPGELLMIGQSSSPVLRAMYLSRLALGRMRLCPTVFEHKWLIRGMVSSELRHGDRYPCVVPNWDNTPRSGRRGIVYRGSTPELFRKQLRAAIDSVGNRDPEQRLIFVKSWNEWAEGNHLEPDRRWGDAYLRVVHEEVDCGVRAGHDGGARQTVGTRTVHQHE